MSEFPSFPDLDILDKVGDGGMSSVWRARDLKRGKIVAVKILKEDLTRNTEDLELFFNEEKTMSTIKHPGIVRSYDLKYSKGSWYYVMEFVDGYNFGALLKRKQHLCEIDCLLIGEAVATALDYAWIVHGVVHCDIKPENIMINTDGIVKLTDLGISRTVHSLKGVSTGNSDHILGTPAYISPEQIYGDVKLDCRADIYSLGATLYHLATGRMLFPHLSGEDMIRAHCDPNAQGKDPREYSAGLSQSFCQMLEAMLVKDRDSRLSTWQDVVAMCKDVEHGVRFKPRGSPGPSSLHLR